MYIYCNIKMLLMKKSVLNLKEKETQHWFCCF